MTDPKRVPAIDFGHIHSLPGTERTPVIANFIDENGAVVEQRSGANLPLPSMDDSVSFGELRTGEGDRIDPETSDYDLGSTRFRVADLEYNYSRVRDASDDVTSEFVMVSVYLEAESG